MHKGPQCQSSAPLCPLTLKNLIETSMTESHDICIFLHSYLFIQFFINYFIFIYLSVMHLFVYIVFFTCHLMPGIFMLDREDTTAWKSWWNNISIFKSEKFPYVRIKLQDSSFRTRGKEEVIRIPLCVVA